jgi:hypothetical protein
MIKVKVDKDVNEVMEIVRELRQHGMTQGTDFDFAYYQTVYDPISGHLVESKHAVFMFHTEKYATLFSLKWST